MHVAAKEFYENVLDTELWLVIVKYRCMTGGYIIAMTDDDIEEELIEKTLKYEWRFHWVFLWASASPLSRIKQFCAGFYWCKRACFAMDFEGITII